MNLLWVPVAGFSCSVEREDGRRLAVSLYPDPKHIPLGGKWAVMALESPSIYDDERILNDHAHKIIGSYPTPIKAIEAGESFVLAWLEDHKQTRAEKCECAELAEPR